MKVELKRVWWFGDSEFDSADDFFRHVTDLINNAKHEIVIASAWFTRMDIAQAIVNSHAKMKFVVLNAADLFRKDELISGHKVAQYLREKGIPTYVAGEFKMTEKYPKMMHAKVAVIDDYVLVGSMNWSSSQQNYEIVLEIKDSDLAYTMRCMIATFGETPLDSSIDIMRWDPLIPVIKQIIQAATVNDINRIYQLLETLSDDALLMVEGIMNLGSIRLNEGNELKEEIGMAPLIWFSKYIQHFKERVKANNSREQIIRVISGEKRLAENLMSGLELLSRLHWV